MSYLGFTDEQLAAQAAQCDGGCGDFCECSDVRGRARPRGHPMPHTCVCGSSWDDEGDDFLVPPS